jgi:hypothetical protein
MIRNYIHISIFSILIFAFSTSLYSQCFMSTMSHGMYLESTTGDRKLDEILFKQKEDLESFFGVEIQLLFGTEISRSGNAFFSPACPSLYCDGKVVLGKYLMLELSRLSNSYTRLLGVFAHEFGHAMQHKYGWSGNSKWRELHADYLAGFYLGKTRVMTQSDVVSSFREFSSRGDFDFYNPDHHGTPEERGCSFYEGYKFASVMNSNVFHAYNSGKNYILANNPCNKYAPQRASALDVLYLFGAAPEAAIIAAAAFAVGAVIVYSNDLYIHPTFGHYLNLSEGNQNNGYGYGWSYGLRKQFTHSALEYGVTRMGYLPKTNSSFTGGGTSSFFFNLNYVRNIKLRFMPSRLIPYLGAGLNLGQGYGVSAMTGVYLPLIDRFTLDARYELGTRTNQFHVGLIFKFQKEYIWNRMKQKRS